MKAVHDPMSSWATWTWWQALRAGRTTRSPLAPAPAPMPFRSCNLLHGEERETEWEGEREGRRVIMLVHPSEYSETNHVHCPGQGKKME